ncbi:reverse transcriptase domain-containing protein [Tanacetum coccineum]|uniref:Reverse transcriptase domain-containing protein n=1 Tax=Tanacetum coccineum TaxID=301880 RepID=A0ABQ5EH40_9ASTR
MQHPVDGRAWKNFDTKYPNFSREPRKVRLGLVVDGFNPFGNLSKAYSMWPMIFTTYNLPLWPLIDDLKQYLPNEVAKPIVELCLFFKQICSATLMEDDMLKAQSKRSIFWCESRAHIPPLLSLTFMTFTWLSIYLLEALKGGHIRRPLSDLDNATLHIDGQSTEVDVPPDIIDLDKDGDIINDEDALPNDLADSDDEDLVNVDDDDGVDMSADVARGHDDGGDDRPPTHHIPTGCGGCFANRGKGTRKPNLGGRKAGRLHTCQETSNLGLKKITDDKGHTQFDLTPHMQSQRWADINAGIQQHLQKLYNTNKASLKAAHWVINPETGTYDVETIRQGRPESITLADWDAQIAFWNDPRNQARAAQNRQNRAKSTVVCRQGSRSLARLRDQMMESSATREYLSLIYTFFMTHTVNGVFTRDEDRAIYEEMLRLQALGFNTPSGVPYTEEEINALARKGKQRGHLPGVGRVLPGRATDVLIPPPPPPPQCTHNSGDVEKLKKKNKYLTKQFGSGSGGCRDDEMADDEDGDEDEEDEEDDDS